MSMYRMRSTEVVTKVNEEVLIKGWLHNLRALGQVNFLIIRDGWGIIQCVIDKDTVVQLNELAVESVLSVSGTVIANPQAPGGIELHSCKVEIIEPAMKQVPFELNQKTIKANIDTFLNHAQIGLRHPSRKAYLRLAAGIMQGFRQILIQKNFTEIQTPKLVASATEGGANVFSVDYFGQPAYLSQSPQFYKQMMVGVFERVFEVGPAFRAEPHNTSRHINEYVSLDVEFGFIKDHTTVMTMVEHVVDNILSYLQEKYLAEIDLLDIKIEPLQTAIPVISFQEAQALILEMYHENCHDELDLSPQHERWLGDWAKEQHNSDFLFVTGYPMAKRPFYTHPNPQSPDFSNSFDLLYRGIELVTGGQRLHKYQDYIDALKKINLSPSEFKSYLDTFQYGMPPHGGFAIGMERFVKQLTGVTNIKEVTLFPRDMNRLTP